MPTQKRPLQDIVPKPHVPRTSRVQQPEPRFDPIPHVPKRQKVHEERREQAEESYPIRDEIQPTVYENDSVNTPYPMGSLQKRMKRRFPWIVTLIGVVCVVGVVGFLLSFAFSGASVSVHPKAQQAYIKGNFIATQASIPGQLTFSLANSEKVEAKEVAATKTEHVEDHASGQITILNNYDTSEQRLITNTRFEGSNGKIYRIRGPVIVPGRKPNPDGTFTPGSVDTMVYADEAGEAYNVSSTDFKIPGFEGTPRYEGFSAKTKTPIDGGFAGDRKTVDDAQLAAIRQDLDATLKAELAKAGGATANNEQATTAPEGFVTYNDAVFYDFQDLPLENNGDKVKIQVKGTVHRVLFDEKTFAKFLATQAIADYDGNDLTIINPNDLHVTASKLNEEEASAVPWEQETLRITIEGTGKFVWLYDEQQLKKDLAGKEKAALPTILAAYPSIERAEVEIRPFWKSTLPKEAEKITVKKTLD